MIAYDLVRHDPLCCSIDYQRVYRHCRVRPADWGTALENANSRRKSGLRLNLRPVPLLGERAAPEPPGVAIVRT
jgi:hypothetical protein